MYNDNQAQSGPQVPNFGLSQVDHQFVSGAARDHAGDIQAMLPDAFAVIKFAAAVVGILAVGCAVMKPQETVTRNRFGNN